MPKTLYAAISHHGFGHLGQLAPVLRQYHQQHPDTRYIIQCALDQSLLAQWLPFDFQHIREATDLGMLMHNALDIQVQQSHRAYRTLHEQWQKQRVIAARLIGKAKPDLVISNIGYLPLAAAAKNKIPSLALCSLNWADIYRAYCGDLPHARDIIARMEQSYQSAERFLIPTPGMPMPQLTNTDIIGPLSRLGQRDAALRARWGVSERTRLVMISLGGIPFRIDWQTWPSLPDVVWLVPDPRLPPQRSDMKAFNTLQAPFIDILANCDAVITKPGYGMFSESACHGVPVLYCRRRDWPEEPWLVNWLKRSSRAREISRDALLSGEVGEHLERLWALPATPPIAPSGVAEAVAHLEALM